MNQKTINLSFYQGNARYYFCDLLTDLSETENTKDFIKNKIILENNADLIKQSVKMRTQIG